MFLRCTAVNPLGVEALSAVIGDLARGVEIAGVPTLVGREQQHLRLTFRQGDMLLRGIGFAMGERLTQAKTGVLDIVFTPQRHMWKEREELQLVLRDLAPHSG